jgi:hypothetical protein
MSTVIGTYKDITEAQRVVTALREAGYTNEQISLVASNTDERYREWVRDHNGVDVNVVDEDVSGGEGAIVGGIEGGVIGMALGLGALAIPGIGPIVAMGPLLGGLIGAGVGAVTGGITAALIDLGVPEDDIDAYAEATRRGYVLVIASNLNDAQMDKVEDVMNLYDVVDIDERSDYWRSEGWTSYDPETDPYTLTEYERERNALSDNSFYDDDFNTYHDDFHTHYTTHYANTNFTFDDYKPGYHYGYTLATNPRYRSYSTWAELEPEARREWNTQYQDSAWENFKDSVRYGWEKVKDAFTFDDDYDKYHDDFYNHYNNYYTNTAYGYNDYEPAYRYGYILATNPRYNSYNTWDELEPEARREWNTRHHDSAWEDFKDSVRYGWERVKAAVPII